MTSARSMNDSRAGKRPVALTYMNYYLPGFQAGGAMRTLLNMVDAIGDQVEFRIATRDRDLLDTDPYPDVATGEWVEVGKAQVNYMKPENLSFSYCTEFARNTPHDLVYCASFFDVHFTLMPLLLRWLGRTPRVPIVVAPQNELSPGALSLKAPKKKVFLAVGKLIGLYRDVIFHASSELEREEIKMIFPNSQVVVARNLLRVPEDDQGASPSPKQAGKLRVIFLSRIHEKKNLGGAIQFLGDADLRGEIEFDIFGPIDEAEYWADCQELIANLPDNVRVHVRGPIENDRLGEIMPDYHLFILPTLGESFGYAILEAMLWGCPALISDRTPWMDLEEHGAGWALPLEEPTRFREVIQSCLDAGPEEHAKRVEATRRYARRSVLESGAVEENLQLLLDVLPDASSARDS